MSRKILLADDSLTIQKVVELTFAETDYEVIAVSSGDELLDRLPEVQPDIVICDVIMPGRDGYDVCQEIKSNSETLHLPVILLTGTFEPFDRDRALAAGCSEIITKPFEAKKLVDSVEQLSVTTGAPPPATTVDEEEEEDEEFDGQVTPPPPIEVPEAAVKTEDELEFDEHDVRNDFASEEAIAEAADEPTASDAESSEPDFYDEETPAFEAAAQSIAIDFDPDAPEEENAFELPDVEDPPDSGSFVEPPGDLNTVASDSAIELTDADSGGRGLGEEMPTEEMEDPFSSEDHEQRPQETMEELSPAGVEATDDDRFESETAREEELASEIKADHTMTTPIDVAAVMAQGGAEEAPMVDDEEVSSIEVDMSDADTQDVTEEAERSVDSVEAKSSREAFDSETPAASVATEEPEASLSDEAPVEAIEFDDPAQTVEFSPPSDPRASEAPVESAGVEAPTDTFDAELPEEPAAMETPAEPITPEAETPPVAIDEASLSDHDVDRIAKRLLELASDRIEHIAWEVIPDMAEMVVRERVRELEGESEQ
jgi:CheY-like chemotaxis protein